MISALIPLFSVTVVPEWKIQLIDEAGLPAVNISLDQAWKDYSLEWGPEHVAEGIISDEHGTVVLPPREIRVSVLQLALAKSWDVLPIITVHSSHGPHSYILCRQKTKCFKAYDNSGETSRIVVEK